MTYKRIIRLFLGLLLIMGSTALAENNTTHGVDKGLFTGILNTATTGGYSSEDQVKTLISEGEQVYANGSYQEAIIIYDRILSIDPDSPAGWLGRARAESASGLYEKALDSVQELLFRDPENWHGYLLQGAVLSSLSRHSEAAESYYKALILNETDSYTWAGYGAALFGNGSYEQAQTACRKSEELNPSLFSAYYWDGVAALRLGDNETALARMETVVSLDPGFIDAYIVSSEIRENDGDVPAALDIIIGGIDNNPESIRLWNKKGHLLEILNRDDDAVQAYQVVIRLNPDDNQAKERIKSISGETG